MSDFLTMVNCVLQGVSDHHIFCSQIKTIQEFLQREWGCYITHNLREDNKFVDFPAIQKALEDDNFVELDK